MQLKTILHSVERHKSFVYQPARWADPQTKREIEIPIVPRANGRALCSGCGQAAPGYDRLPARRFEYVPWWQIAVFFRVCHAARELPSLWREGRASSLVRRKEPTHHQLPLVLGRLGQAAFVERGRRSLRHDLAERVSLGKTRRFVGLAQRDLSGIEAIGVDEVQWQRGHKYLTLVYQIDEGRKRLLWIGQDRTAKTLLRFFRLLGKERSAQLKFICSDMWQGYLKAIAKKAAGAVHVLDRFHVMQKMNKAIDEVRAAEAKQLQADGYEPVLKRARWCLLKRRENLTDKQTVKLKELLKYNLRSVRAHLLREDFQRFWEYVSPTWAGKFLDHWCTRTMRSRLEPMKKVARTLRKHRPLILNWFRAKGAISAGTVEGFNNKVKLTTRKSYGFRTYDAIEIALYHNLGNLPEPEFTHKFW